MSSELAENVLARLFLGVVGLDALRGSAGTLSLISSDAMPSSGGVEGGVSESVLVSVMVARLSPLLRGLAAVLWYARIFGTSRTSGLLANVFGSVGMGLSGSLVAHCGMLLCRWWCIALKDSRRVEGVVMVL